MPTLKNRDIADVLGKKHSHFRDLLLEFWELGRHDGEIRMEDERA